MQPGIVEFRVRVLALALLASGPAVGEDFCVGQGPGATHATLQAAFDTTRFNGPAEDTVYVSLELTYESQQLLVVRQNLYIVGVTDCASLAESVVQIDGDGEHSVFTITALNDETVRMRNLRIGGGGDDGTGGGIDQRGRVNLVLDAVTVAGNGSTQGGGIYIQNALGANSGIVTLLPGTVIEQNTASTYGGGILADGGRVRMHASDTVIRDNIAGVGGGGVAVTAGELSVGRFVATAANGSATGALIQGNSAGSGGGVLVAGVNSYLFANELIVNGNAATTTGGGIYADNGAYVGFQRDSADPQSAFNCTALAGCNRISNNSVPDLADGGGIALTRGARAYLYQSVLKGNRARYGSVALVESGSTLNLEGDLITGNTCVRPQGLGCSHIEVSSGTANIRYSTFGDNAPPPNVVVKRQSALINVFSTIFSAQYAVLVYGPTSEYRLDCIVAPFGGGPAPDGPTVTRVMNTGNLGFVDFATDDYRLLPTSAAVDYCDATLAVPNVADLALAGRGYNGPSIELYGTYDLGAFEYYPPVDALFKDGFEFLRL